MARILEREGHLQAVAVSGIVIAVAKLQLVDELFEWLEHCDDGKLFEFDLLDRSVQVACALAGDSQQAAEVSRSKTIFESTILDIEIRQINFIMGHNSISCKSITEQEIPIRYGVVLDPDGEVYLHGVGVKLTIDLRKKTALFCQLAI
ncbi:hypothetical protein FF100_13745 [Methylobacterium terricola]|uniref:Uncharacterized protein n=1 Tax=Methylobacterium terricola TaxID=2583531 RepID=A0A5C4LK09_9HYPH|nr:hypothetical protein [Methylobacterium terricola]TNC12727.1 hypothetical protein FF100_13745 [Methylobacterium terricola]